MANERMYCYCSISNVNEKFKSNVRILKKYSFLWTGAGSLSNPRIYPVDTYSSVQMYPIAMGYIARSQSGHSSELA